ncbi:MAG: hypothetical protein C4319_02595 [Acidimicrobiia bacterium]
MTESGIPSWELERRESVDRKRETARSGGGQLIDEYHAARLAVVGTGRVGSTLARSLAGAGWNVCTVMGSSPRSTSSHRLATELGCEVASGYESLLEKADVVLLCVPDSVLEETATALAQISDWGNDRSQRRLVGHTSGSHGISVLRQLASLGWSVFSLHPVVSIAHPDSGPEVLKGKYAGITASRAALPVAQEMAVSLGMIPFEVYEEHRPAYHLACSMASNFLVTLLAIAEQITEGVGIKQGASIFVPLVESTVANLGVMSPMQALTGPIARGDVPTVRAHLAALEKSIPRLIPCYLELATATLDVARLDAVKREQMETLISEWKLRVLDMETPARESRALNEASASGLEATKAWHRGRTVPS